VQPGQDGPGIGLGGPRYFLAAVVFAVVGAAVGSPVTWQIAAGLSTARFNLSSTSTRTTLSVKSVPVVQNEVERVNLAGLRKGHRSVDLARLCPFSAPGAEYVVGRGGDGRAAGPDGSCPLGGISPNVRVKRKPP